MPHHFQNAVGMAPLEGVYVFKDRRECSIRDIFQLVSLFLHRYHSEKMRIFDECSNAYEILQVDHAQAPSFSLQYLALGQSCPAVQRLHIRSMESIPARPIIIVSLPDFYKYHRQLFENLVTRIYYQCPELVDLVFLTKAELFRFVSMCLDYREES